MVSKGISYVNADGVFFQFLGNSLVSAPIVLTSRKRKKRGEKHYKNIKYK